MGGRLGGGGVWDRGWWSTGLWEVPGRRRDWWVVWAPRASRGAGGLGSEGC